ncbi:MAG: DUF86 domain-containing protein [Methanomassiliicoccaceae archaeon]|jgi:uncharacterized protein with HEPN domain|nr:DUF86 domain-containing protein [Methanomassiliicoccaceae archaeon]
MEHFADDEGEIMDNEFFQDVSSFYIGQIGESAGNLSAELVGKYPEIRRKEIVGMRNIVSHRYETLNTTV